MQTKRFLWKTTNKFLNILPSYFVVTYFIYTEKCFAIKKVAEHFAVNFHANHLAACTQMKTICEGYFAECSRNISLNIFRKCCNHENIFAVYYSTPKLISVKHFVALSELTACKPSVCRYCVFYWNFSWFHELSMSFSCLIEF